jgi:anti-sigma factor RsiW
MKAKRACSLLDKYRDKELSDADRSAFESHLTACDDCRMAMALLNNVIHAMKMEEAESVDRADAIARNAFRRASSWDFEVISWLRPGPALAALALMLALSSVWMISSGRRVTSYSEYEKLIEEADAVNVGSGLSQIRNDSELVTWLEREGNSQ